MAIALSKLTVSTKAAVGTVIGALTVFDTDGTTRTVNYWLNEGSAGFFNVTGGNLVTLRAAIPPGFYSVGVNMSAQFVRYEDEANFVVQVTAT
jgi:hypothetical protein